MRSYSLNMKNADAVLPSPAYSKLLSGIASESAASRQKHLESVSEVENTSHKPQLTSEYSDPPSARKGRKRHNPLSMLPLVLTSVFCVFTLFKLQLPLGEPGSHVPQRRLRLWAELSVQTSSPMPARGPASQNKQLSN